MGSIIVGVGKCSVTGSRSVLRALQQESRPVRIHFQRLEALNEPKSCPFPLVLWESAGTWQLEAGAAEPCDGFRVFMVPSAEVYVTAIAIEKADGERFYFVVRGVGPLHGGYDVAVYGQAVAFPRALDEDEGKQTLTLTLPL